MKPKARSMVTDGRNSLSVRFPTGAEATMGNVLTSSQAANQPSVEWAAHSNAFYTLAMVDPDLFGRNGTNYGQLKHWLVVNIAGADLQNGRQLTEFIPCPPEAPDFIGQPIGIDYYLAQFDI
ncbi:unnamed protein product [Medioppia subpectinata]|uniref:Uncharacterized protein n=1 Tax=Medioppia subpectinata TaxID=1979941 RepID=A0A7R9LJY0_9ACAR|nr:unnamed protein product [Medioppia subpectinata]CAG2119139.1 unnamed protein product [Medioppia subpectinata]